MKIVIQAYNTFKQNSSGGVQVRIDNLFNFFKTKNNSIDLFNKWETKISNYEIIHFFKASIEHYNLMVFAKKNGLKIVLSSIMPIEGLLKIKISLIISQYLKVNTTHFYIKKNFDLSDIILAQTIKEKKFISEAYNINFNKIKIIPNGISPFILDGDEQLFRKTYKIKGDFLLSVGRIDPNKNQLNVIKAIKNTDIKYVIIGGPDPEDQTGYYQLCKENANENVIFLGWIDSKDPILAAAYAAAKVLVLSSFKEIYGNCIYEALANNCLVACTNELEFNDTIINQYIKKFDPNDLKQIQDTLVFQMNKNENIEVSNYILKNYTWSKIADKHLNIYKELLQNVSI